MIYLRKLLNLIIKKGKKTIALKTLNKTIEKIRPALPPSKLNNLFENLAPMVKIQKKKVAGKLYQIPVPISEKRAVFQTVKWIMMGVDAEKKGKKLSVKVGRQLLNTYRGKGTAITLKKQFMDIVKENRSYMRFIKRKRKKKKKWIFQQRFTSKSIKREKRRKVYLEIKEEKVQKRKQRVAKKKARKLIINKYLTSQKTKKGKKISIKNN